VIAQLFKLQFKILISDDIKTYQPGTVVHFCNTSTQKAEAGEF
jgi:hypothetical protein